MVNRQGFVKIEFDTQYEAELIQYYLMPWYKRLFKKPPTPKNPDHNPTKSSIKDTE